MFELTNVVTLSVLLTVNHYVVLSGKVTLNFEINSPRVIQSDDLVVLRCTLLQFTVLVANKIHLAFDSAWSWLQAHTFDLTLNSFNSLEFTQKSVTLLTNNSSVAGVN